MTTTRRIYLYLIAIISLGVLAGGVGQLLSLFLNLIIVGQQTPQVGARPFAQGQLSLGLAMTIIGGPLWFFFWRSIQKHASTDPEEIGEGLRKFFLNLIILITSLTAVGTGASFLNWLLDGAFRTYFNSGNLATFIVTGAIWYYHWNVSEKEGHPTPITLTLRRWYIYILSGFGLIWFAEAVVEFISAGVLSLPVWGGNLVETSFWNDATQSAVSRIIFGGVVWYFHWFRMAKGDFDSVLRQVYFYVLTVSGGAIAALVAATITLQKLITWAMGGVQGQLNSYFSFIGWAIPTMLIGVAIWGYHQKLAKEEKAQAAESLKSSERVHHYLMSFIGLGTTSSGLILLFALIINLIIGFKGQPIAVGTGYWQSLLGLSLAMLIVGVPLWLYYWSRVLARTEAGGIEEWRAASRRIFLYSVVIIAIGTLIADFVNIIYQLLNSLFQANINTVIRNMSWSIQTLLVAGPFLWYHFRIIRADQKRGAEVLAIRRIVTIFTYDRTGETLKKLEEKLGYRINILYRPGTGDEPPVTEEELTRIKAEIDAAPAPRVMIIAVGGKFVTAPYSDKI